MDIYKGTLFRDLEKLNYTINEAKVYITLLQNGPSLAGKIAKQAKLDRSSTYNALKQLEKRGVISTIHENKRTTYIPEDPKKITDYYKEKEEIAKRILPELKKQFHKESSSSSVKLFKGFKGLKTVFQDILDTSNEKSTYYVLGAEGQFTKEMPYYAPIFRKRKEQKKLKTKIFVRKTKNKKSKYTQYKKIPSDIESPATINIYNNKVAIFMWEETPQAILIENKDVARTLENYFNFMWKHAK